ncbi:MAG TPA: ATP-binding protein [candidate division Zixibacteria bacterium]|jgi:serine/threonine-protein kinase RsbW|nr:ATP-binding protein [candidate division Zixibacteria bacterium]HBZ01982.1 ATP-binding protein [candidate division Zixibacteria bacterium]
MMAKSSGDDITISSSLDHIAAVDEFLEEWLRRQNIPEDTIADLAIAVTELVNNAIKHGNKGNLAKKVTVSLHFANGVAQATVGDEGEGFDPESIPNPIAEENLLKAIGRGIFIVKSLMDKVEFAFPATGGTRITITKKVVN